MRQNGVIRVGLSGLGAFSIVIADGVKRSKKVERVTCYDVIPERRKATSEKYGCGQEKSYDAEHH